MARPFASTKMEFRIGENLQPARHWAMRLWIILIACWLVVTGLSAFRPIQAQIARVHASDLSGFARLFIYSLNYLMHAVSIWSMIAGVWLLAGRELARRFTIAFCWVELVLRGVAMLIDGYYWLYFGHPMVLPPQYNHPYKTLSTVMYSVYIIAILIFLTRPKVVAFFRRND